MQPHEGQLVPVAPLKNDFTINDMEESATSHAGLGVATVAGNRNKPNDDMPLKTIAPRAAFVGNVAVGTFHPKTIVFFVRFAPSSSVLEATTRNRP